MRLRKLKTWGFAAITVAACLGAIEGSTLVVYRLVAGRFFPYGRFREAIAEASVAGERASLDARADPGVIAGGREVIHPYFGYTYNPETPGISAWGFIDEDSPVTPPSDRTTVAVFGGSFASLLCIYSEGVLARELEAVGRRDVTFVNLALGGYKQPQQLLILAYLLSLGAHFDIVVNVDGFNEVTLPPLENLPNGVFPLYPRQWATRMTNVLDPEVALRLASLDAARTRRRTTAAFFDRTRLSRTATGGVVWTFLNRRLQHREYELSASLNRLQGSTRPSVTGPPFRIRDDARLYSYLAEHWARCSSLMHELCRSHGIAYFHFLQPNQYVPGSKPMGDKERHVALGTNKDWGPCVARGYPLLREHGRKLSSTLHFYDMTMVFADNPEVLYADDCCHLNGRGYDLFAHAVGRIIAGALREDAQRGEAPR